MTAPKFPFPDPNPVGWSGIQPVTDAQISQINANAAAAADGARWSDFTHLQNWRYGSWFPVDIFSTGSEQYVPAYLRAQTFMHWVPGADAWLRADDYLGEHALYISRDKGFHFRTLPTTPIDRKPWLCATKDSTGEVAVLCNSSGGSDTYKILSFTLQPPFLNDGTSDDEVAYIQHDTGFAPVSLGFSPRDFVWVPERQWWMFGFVGTSGGVQTSPSLELDTWTNRAAGVMDGSHGVLRFAGNGEGVYLATNSAADSLYFRSDDGGETWAEANLPIAKGASNRITYVPDLGRFVFFANEATPGTVYTSETAATGSWTASASAIRVKDAQGAGRVLVAILDPTGDNTNQQLVASVDAGGNWFRLGCDIDGYNTVRFNGKQAAIQKGAYPSNGTDSAFVCSGSSA